MQEITRFLTEAKAAISRVKAGVKPRSQEDACQTVYRLSVRGKTLVDERNALAETGRKLRKEIANGIRSGKGQVWLETKQAKLLNVGDEWSRVNTLILDGHTTRQRAQGRFAVVGAKNILHYGA